MVDVQTLLLPYKAEDDYAFIQTTPERDLVGVKGSSGYFRKAGRPGMADL